MQPSRSDPELPKACTALSNILDGKIASNKLVNVIGHVKDFQRPIASRGTDYKCVIGLADESTQHAVLPLHIFRPEADMPVVSGGDVVLVFNAKVQDRRGHSLLTHHSTEIHVYSCEKIPSPPQDASRAHRPPRAGTAARRDMSEFHSYVTAFHVRDGENVPERAAFEIQVQQSVNRRDKFALLSDIRADRFYDVIVEVLRDPFRQADMQTLWVSDYTVNPQFYDGGMPENAAADHDDNLYGAISKFGRPTTRTQYGPHGQRSFQVTCFDIHAARITDAEIKMKDYVRLRNVLVKMGRNGNNLEGKLREDSMHLHEHQIHILHPEGEDAETNSRVKDLIKRKRDYYKSLRSSDNGNNNNNNRKRKSVSADLDVSGHGPSKMKSKPRSTKKERSERRAEQERRRAASERDGVNQEQELEQEQELRPGPTAPPAFAPSLNPYVRCEAVSHTITSVEEVKRQHLFTDDITGISFPLPFDNRNYMVHVRVVDFRPKGLGNFARQKSEYDALTDAESSDDDNSSYVASTDGASVDDAWEWAFWLLLEDAVPSHPRERVWVVVGNMEAQCLLGLDAVDLNRDLDAHELLRTRLAVLWGGEKCGRKQSHQSQHRDMHYREIPPDSSPVPVPSALAEPSPTNLPFACLIRQYGIKVPEPDPTKANAGDSRRWERVYGLFGTQIKG